MSHATRREPGAGLVALTCYKALRTDANLLANKQKPALSLFFMSSKIKSSREQGPARGMVDPP